MARPPRSPQELLDSGHLRTLPRDPWRRPYQLSIDPYQAGLLVGSYGRDGRPGGRQENSDWLCWIPLTPWNPRLSDLWLAFPAHYGVLLEPLDGASFPFPPAPLGTPLPL
jgi:hypothetical protein